MAPESEERRSGACGAAAFLLGSVAAAFYCRASSLMMVLARLAMSDATSAARPTALAWKLLHLRARQLRLRLRAGAALQRAVRGHRARATRARWRAAGDGHRASGSRPHGDGGVPDRRAQRNGNWEFHPVVKHHAGAPRTAVLTAQFFAHNLTGHDTSRRRYRTSRRRRRRLVSQDRVLLLLAAALLASTSG
jgi:hypothetical protein